jgi:hypothetical protein
MIKFPFVAGHAPVHHCRQIGKHEDHQALRRRNELRLIRLKAANRLYEDKNESVATGGDPSAYYTSAACQFGCSCFGAILGLCSCSNNGSGIGTSLFDDR